MYKINVRLIMIKSIYVCSTLHGYTLFKYKKLSIIYLLRLLNFYNKSKLLFSKKNIYINSVNYIE